MKIYIEVFNIEGEHILSRNVSFDGGWYNINKLYSFFEKLDDMILMNQIEDIRLLPTEKSKRFTLELVDKDNQYFISNSRAEIVRTDDEIISDIAEFFRINPSIILDRCRKKESVKPRQFAMFLLWYVNKRSTTNIGKIFLKDHATVLHSISKVLSAYIISRDQQITMAVEYFSQKYDLSLIYVIEKIMKGKRLSEIDGIHR